MTTTRHRATCQDPDCGRVWREDCAECAQDMADKHRRETGHPVHLAIIPDGPTTWELREMTRRAHRMLFAPRRGR